MASVRQIVPVDPCRALHELVYLVKYVAIFVAASLHLHPERHEVFGCDGFSPVDVNPIEHLLGAQVVERTLEKVQCLLVCDHMEAIDVHFMEQFLASSPYPCGKPAKQRTFGKPDKLHTARMARLAPRRAGGTRERPIDPRLAVHERVDLVHDRPLFISSGSHLQPKVHKFFRCDGPVVVHVQAIAHLVGADVAEDALEEVYRFLMGDCLASVGVDLVEKAFALLPCRRRKPAEEWPLREWLHWSVAGAAPIHPIDPRRASHDLVDFVHYFLFLVPGGSHLQPERYEFVGGDGPAFVNVNLIKHRSRADTGELAFEERLGLLSRDGVAAIHIHHVEQILNFFPRVRRKFA
mmetsp:Transcript_40664/g.111892  ORF Transcript_40664/g.111892 Transcript_40664/m.111892 type:complete len:350 (-) Transcript_40664:370-1419(-)